LISNLENLKAESIITTVFTEITREKRELCSNFLSIKNTRIQLLIEY